MHQKKHTSSQTTTKGSFLLELLIAFAIISIALTVVVDSFISSQRSYRIIAAQTELTRSLSMVLEDMTQEARVSEDFACGVGNPAPCSAGDVFSMVHIEGLNGQGAGETISYTFNDVDGEIEKTDPDGDSAKMTTNTKIKVTRFSVYVKEDTDVQQRQAFIALSAESVESPDIKVDLQTSFSERSY
jgi:type II secretory pathway pseudopilin PulG